MNYLSNGCRYSDFNIYPGNWASPRASLKKKWRIEYRFYDDSFKKDYPKGYRKEIKNGLNRITSLQGRQQMVREFLTLEKRLLTESGYNPITESLTKKTEKPLSGSQDRMSVNLVLQGNNSLTFPIDDGKLTTKAYLLAIKDFIPNIDTTIISAFWMALNKADIVAQAKNDVGSIIRGIEKASKLLDFDALRISEVKTKHFRLIFDKCAEINPRFSNARRNKYKDYLSILMKQLVTLEAVESNCLKELDAATETKNDRNEPTDEERQLISKHLRSVDYNFWRFIQIFFHSGSRESELMRMKLSHVDWKRKRFKVLIKKRKRWVWKWKVIKNIALPFWEELLADCQKFIENTKQDIKADDIILFSKFLAPGSFPIRPDQVGRRWTKHVKNAKTGLGIDVDLYTLKHINTTEQMDILSQDGDITAAENDSAEHNGHTTSAMVQGVYDLRSVQRKGERIRKVNNAFA